jgi:hypothetical protein
MSACLARQQPATAKELHHEPNRLDRRCRRHCPFRARIFRAALSHAVRPRCPSACRTGREGASWGGTRSRQRGCVAQLLGLVAQAALPSEDLVAAIDDYVAQRHTKPKPFIWTKSAADILQKVIRAASGLSGKQNETRHWPTGTECAHPACALRSANGQHSLGQGSKRGDGCFFFQLSTLLRRGLGIEPSRTSPDR